VVEPVPRGCEGSGRLMLDRVKAYTDENRSVSPQNYQ
jgi:hypothetical protein